MIPQRLAPRDSRVAQKLSSCRALVEELASLHNPVPPRRIQAPLQHHVSLAVALARDKGHRVDAVLPDADRISRPRLSARFSDGTLESSTPQGALTPLGLNRHE